MLTVTVNIDGIEIAYQFSDTDVLALRNDLLDIPDWIRGAVAGKINQCRKRMVKSGIDVLLSDPTVTSIPASEDEIVQALVLRSDYKDRADRESGDGGSGNDVIIA